MAKTVLVVEDDQDIQNYYDIVLSDLGLELLKASNGRDAIAIINSGIHLDMIILDVVMPVMDGEKFLRELRLERNSTVPVIVSSVDEVSAARLTAIAKVDGVFFKLNKVDDLKAMIVKTLHKTSS